MTASTSVPAVSRRSILTATAKLAAAGALTGIVATASGTSTSGAAKDDRRRGARNPGDAAALTILLQIERRQIGLYRAFIRRFGLDESTSGDRAEIGYAHVHQILRQENRHAAELEDALAAAGGDVPAAHPATPTFADEAAFNLLAAEIEAEAVAAYTAALPTLSNPEALALGLGILAVEARQAAVTSAHAGITPLADDIQPALTRKELSRFLVSAPTSGNSPLLNVED